jgi:hypothetical protein
VRVDGRAKIFEASVKALYDEQEEVKPGRGKQNAFASPFRSEARKSSRKREHRKTFSVTDEESNPLNPKEGEAQKPWL